jgi:hypothetical protein
VQVDPIKSTLKVPGTKRLKLKCGKLLSSFAFSLNLRRYNVAWSSNSEFLAATSDSLHAVAVWRAGAYTCPSFSST